MILILVILIFGAHSMLIFRGGKLRFLLPALIGGPALFLLSIYAVSMSDRNKDVLYNLPLLLLAALILPEIFFWVKKVCNKSRPEK